MSDKSVMTPIIDYIDTLPVRGSTKWFANVLAKADKRVFTQQWIVQNTSFKKRTARDHLYKLIDCGVVSRHKAPGSLMHYVISDTRLIHHIAAEENGFEPINPPESPFYKGDKNPEEEE